MGVAEKLALGKAVHGSGGAVLEASRLGKTKIATESPSLVALHEAGHVFVAFMCGVGVHNANIVPDGPIEGTTWLKRFNATALAAGAALGDHAGAGGDRQIAMANGVDWASAVSSAQSLIKGNMHVIRAIASSLQKWKSLGDGDLQSVFTEAKNGAEVVITLTDADGATQETTTRTTPGTSEIHIPLWMIAALMQAGKKEIADLEKSGVALFPVKPKEGGKLDVRTEADFNPRTD